MKRKNMVIAIILLSIISFVCYFYIFRYEEKILFRGSMYVNDSGEPKGGFEWAGEYNVTITKDKMKLEFIIGLGDPLTKHSYNIKIIEFRENEYVKIRIENGSNPLIHVDIIFEYVENDTIWNSFHHYYIAYHVPPTLFPGFHAHYYVEIRIKPVK